MSKSDDSRGAPASSARWLLRGRCHKFGDNIPLDGGLIPFKYAIGRVMDPAELIPHLFEEIAPGFHERAKRGDIVVAGKRFACGKPHVQGFIALRAMGIGFVCESMPFNSLRGAVSRGATFMTNCEGVTGLAEDGDELEVNFWTGEFRNLTSGSSQRFSPLDASLLDMIAMGGSDGLIRRRSSSQG